MTPEVIDADTCRSVSGHASSPVVHPNKVNVPSFELWENSKYTDYLRWHRKLLTLYSLWFRSHNIYFPVHLYGENLLHPGLGKIRDLYVTLDVIDVDTSLIVFPVTCHFFFRASGDRKFALCRVKQVKNMKFLISLSVNTLIL